MLTFQTLQQQLLQVTEGFVYKNYRYWHSVYNGNVLASRIADTSRRNTDSETVDTRSQQEHQHTFTIRVELDPTGNSSGNAYGLELTYSNDSQATSDGSLSRLRQFLMHSRILNPNTVTID
jgi:hypothetical protein